MLLVVGDSAAGKSRSTVEALRAELPSHRLLRPRVAELSQVPTLPLPELSPCVLWLDDLDRYAGPNLGDTLETLLNGDVAVVGTIRRAALEALTQTGDVPAPATRTLQDTRLLQYQNWRLKWSDEERHRVPDHVTHTDLLRRVAAGTPLGVWCVAGPLLVERLRQAREELPCRHALIQVVLDWYRTGVGRRIPVDVALAHMVTTTEPAHDLDEDEVDDALRWATSPVMGAGRATRQSILSLAVDPHELSIHDYILDQYQG